MIKFKITPERFAEVCTVLEYMNVLSKNRAVIMNVAPRFVIDDNEQYIMRANLDGDGDITGYENREQAVTKMVAITPKRLEKLYDEFCEAAKGIVNPTSGAGLNAPSSTATEQPPPG